MTTIAVGDLADRTTGLLFIRIPSLTVLGLLPGRWSKVPQSVQPAVDSMHKVAMRNHALYNMS